MANKTDRIEHQGVVEKIANDHIVVNILQQAGCLSCAVKSACNPTESDTKSIEIQYFGNDYILGEQVNVFYERALGFKALLWGYLLPFVLLMVVLLIAVPTTGSEMVGGLIALGSLLPYYGMLYLNRNNIKKEFAFRIEKIKQTVPITQFV